MEEASSQVTVGDGGPVWSKLVSSSRKQPGQRVCSRRGSCTLRGRLTVFGMVVDLGREGDAGSCPPHVVDSWLKLARRRRDGSLVLEVCACCGAGGHLAGSCPLRTRIAVVGDSHSAIWALLSQLYINTAMARVRVPGMSAQGLGNAQSRSQAASSIRAMLRQCFEGEGPEWLFVVVGQVDIDFVLPFQRLRDPGYTFERQLRCSTANVLHFLRSLTDGDDAVCSLPRERIVLHGVHLPPLGDEAMCTVLADALRRDGGETPSTAAIMNAMLPHKERTHMALEWNRALREQAECEGYVFVSVAEQLLDHESSLVHARFTKPHLTDIHLDIIGLAPLYRSEYRRLGMAFALEEESLPQVSLEMLEREPGGNNRQS